MQIRKNNSLVSRKTTSFCSLLLCIILASCGGGKLIEDYQPLTDNEWRAADVRSFAFSIEDNSQGYDLFFTVKNGLDYPFHNLYVDYKLYAVQNEQDSLITTDLQECLLFDAKTGVPQGSGNSGWYSHEFLILKNHQFSKPGTYEIRFQQYMRRDALKEVASVGFALAKHNPDPR
ncbi:MAG: gliding motility lipoprotein GldH [Bacteroidota bacterium]